MESLCENCRGDRFYLRDGLTYCSRCNFESRAHGHETVVDEETIGTFQEGVVRGLQKSTSKKKRGSRRRSSKLDKYLVSFTSIDVFTFILKGWTKDVIELGAPPSTMETVKILWFQYLKQIGIDLYASDESKNDKKQIAASIGHYPSFRDLQTKITGRRKLLTARSVSDIFKRTKIRLQQKATDSDEDLDSVDELENRKRQKRRRRKFLNSLISDTSDTDASHVSSIASSIASSSFASTSIAADDFNLSFASRSPSASETIASQDSMACSSNVTSPSDGTTSGGNSSASYQSEEENNPEKIVHDAMALKNITPRWKAFKNRYPDLEFPTLRVLFSLLMLGIAIAEDNGITLADLIYWANQGALSYKTCLVHVPVVMKLRSMEDYKQFTPVMADRYPLNHYKIRVTLSRLSSFLDLREVIFPACTVHLVITRFLREFSLPASIHEMIKEATKETDLMKPPKVDLKDQKKTIRTGVPIDSMDIIALSWILVALKYLFGLDDISERLRSADARQFNLDNAYDAAAGRFVVCDWMELSRRRLFVAVRCCDDLHSRFAHLFPRVERTPASLCQSFARLSATCKNMKQGVIDEEESTRRKSRMLKRDERLLTTVGDFIRHNFDEFIRPVSERIHSKVQLDVSKSQTPLHDMSRFIMDAFSSSARTDLVFDQDLDSSDADFLGQLLAMHSQDLGSPKPHPNAEEIQIQGEWVMDAPSVEDLMKGQGQINFSRKDRMAIKHAAYYKFDDVYWRSSASKWKRDLRLFHEAAPSHEIVAGSPESFAWILKYFAAYVGCDPVDLYTDFCRLENSIYETDSDFFGKGLKTAKCRTLPNRHWSAREFSLS